MIGQTLRVLQSLYTLLFLMPALLILCRPLNFQKEQEKEKSEIKQKPYVKKNFQPKNNLAT